MKKLISIGEALIDFIPTESGKKIKQVEGFKPAVGGAPANVCAAFTKLGGESKMITQLGEDPFGDKIIDEFRKYNIGCEYVSRTSEANTSLAFVALDENKNREFSFYRKPGADMLLEADTIKQEWFENIFALHFCSISIGDFPMKQAHDRAIEYTLNNNGIVSFDLNVRLPLWKAPERLREAILEMIPKAHILKISDEELEFVTGGTNIEHELDKLFVGNVKLIIFTKGKDGAEAYTKFAKASIPGIKTQVEDTTGAGDGFIGSFLYQLDKNSVDVDKLKLLNKEDLERYLDFSNRYCAISVTKKGAMDSYPTLDEFLEII